jgi:TldD protein
MPNVRLEAGPPEVTANDLIAGVDDGVLSEGKGSFSIDQQRYHFAVRQRTHFGKSKAAGS